MAVRRWSWIHKWSSLVCTGFLLVLCLTGLPLIFGDEIDQLSGAASVYETLPPETGNVPIDQLVRRAKGMYPGQVVTSLVADDDEPQVYVWLAPSFAALRADSRVDHFVRFDARTGKVIGVTKPVAERRHSVMGIFLRIHSDLFAALPGQLFLGSIGLLFVVAVASGVVLYGPFTRKQGFGDIRSFRKPRTRWLDLHNLLGVVTLAWALVVGATGVMNELSTPLFALWQKTDVRETLARWQEEPVPTQPDIISPQAAMRAAAAALPGMNVTEVLFPGREGGSPYHYLLWGHGRTPLTAHLSSPVLIDAKTGKVAAVMKMPWYLRALEVSRPLHFGDYGGLPLKIIWALLDLVTIVVLGSGLYLWVARPRRKQAAAARQGLRGAGPMMEPAE